MQQCREEEYVDKACRINNAFLRMKKALKGCVNTGGMTKVFVFVIVVSVVMTLQFVFWSSDATSKKPYRATPQKTLLASTSTSATEEPLGRRRSKEGHDTGHALDSRRPRVLVDAEGCRIVEVEADRQSVFYVMEHDWQCCEGESRPLVVAVNDPLTPSLHVDANAFSAYKENLTCGYSAVHLVDDFTSRVSAKVTFLEEEDTPVEDEFVRVVCRLNGRLVWRNAVAFVQRKKDVEERCRKRKGAENENKLSVLFLIVDSVSRGHYLRQMKKTDRFLRRHVNMVDMRGFTKVGKNTFPNMMPMLTGKFWQHWKDTLNLTSASKVDALPLVWKDFAEQGYRVLYNEDMAFCGTFQYTVGGFATQPTDYYFRTVGQYYENANLVPLPCNRGLAEARMMLKWTSDFLMVFAGEPVFALTFLSYMSHESLGTLHLYDDLVLNFFKYLDTEAHLNRSIVFFMSDHGFGNGEGRSTFVGREESKLPFLFILFPRWFASKYPAYASKLKTNANRLVTAFDIHETLLDILRLAEDDVKEEESETNASHVGLFTREVSSKRTCVDARIPRKFCPCWERHPLPLKSRRAQLVGRKLVEAINNFTVEYRKVCRHLQLRNVTDATMLDVDDERQSLHYEVTVKVSPGRGVFEGTVLYMTKDNTFVVQQEQVERVNRYGHQGDCLEDGSLKPFCYCHHRFFAHG